MGDMLDVSAQQQRSKEQSASLKEVVLPKAASPAAGRGKKVPHHESHTSCTYDIDLSAETFCESMAVIGEGFLKKFSVDQITGYQQALKDMASTVESGMRYLTSTVNLLGSVAALKNTLNSEEIDPERRTAAHKSVLSAIEKYNESRDSLKSLDPKERERLLKETERVEQALEELHRMTGCMRDGICETNDLVQCHPGLKNQPKCRRQMQQETDDALESVDGIEARIETLLEKRQAAVGDASLSTKDRAERFAEIDARIEELRGRLRLSGEDFQSTAERVVEGSQLPEHERSSLNKQVGEIWSRTLSAADQAWAAMDKTLHMWAKETLGDEYQRYRELREEASELIDERLSELAEDSKRGLGRGEDEDGLPHGSLYSIEHIASLEELRDEPATTAERIELEMPIRIRIRRFIRFIQRHIIPIPFSRDWREDKDLHEDQRMTEDVDTLHQRDLITGEEGKLPYHIGQHTVTDLQRRVPQYDRITALASKVLRSVKFQRFRGK